MYTTPKNTAARTFYRITFVVLFLSFFIGCTKGYWLTSQADSICEQEADAAIRRGNYEQGIRLHLALLKKEPGNALVLYHLGYAYGMAGDYVKEVQYYEKAIELGYNKDADLYFNLGMVYGELNMIQKAISAFQRAVEIDPNHDEARKFLNSLENK